jgi:hypothetical protein
MPEPDKIYCIDTNVFLHLHLIHKMIPIDSVWSELDRLFAEGKTLSHEYVFDEFYSESSKRDFIQKWIEDKKKYFLSITDRQFELVNAILKEFPDLIDPEKEKNQADPWLIALAIELKEDPGLFGEKKIVVVSQEKITSPKRIPAACEYFHVDHMNLEEFFKDNGWTFGLKNIVE